MNSPIIYRRDYQPYPFEVVCVALQIDLYTQHTEVKAVMRLKRLAPGALHLYGDALELLSIALDDKLLSEKDYQREGDDLILKTVPEAFTLTLNTRIYPHLNTQLSGLYQTNSIFCTQCEAQGFRRMTFFPDRPDVLTLYTTRISASKADYPVLLSNGNLKASGELPDGRHWVEWEDPFKKPSYLFALVAGALECAQDSFVACSGREIDLRLYVEPGQLDKCAHALASLKHAMRWDEAVYGREYDLNTYMIVAVSDFNMGAMENKGLNIFNTSCVLANPSSATDNDYAAVESVVAHEYFHNWTGNRVTCRDWFQLSLKEGLTVFRDQEFSRDRYARDVKRIEDVSLLRQAQFPEDAGPLAHPVRPESYEEINNFYTATVYEKGAEVIRMQHTLLGAEGFRRGMDLYFKRHDGHAVTIDDFVAAMEDANGQDLTQFKLWYSQAGTPEVRIMQHYAAGKLTLVMTQSCPPTPESASKLPFYIPIRIALFAPTGEQIPLTADVLVLSEATQTFEWMGIPEGVVVSLLRDFSAPIKLFFEQSESDQLKLLHWETNGFSKWEALQRVSLKYLTHPDIPKAEAPIPQSLQDVYQHILQDERLDQALRAELLLLPSFEEVAAEFTVVDVSRVEAARKSYRMALANHLLEPALACIGTLWQQETHAMEPSDFARRKLRNTCLGLLCRAGVSEKAWELCQRQFYASKTMTDKITALALLVMHPDVTIATKALADFYNAWSHDALVLDKWFSVQATADRPNALSYVRALLDHPQFSLSNPNKVRALIGGFAHSNPSHFHALDGSGYAFLSEMLRAIDPLNAQIAARLVIPLTRFRRFETKRQSLMQEQLEQLASQKLSKNLGEMIRKALKPG